MPTYYINSSGINVGPVNGPRPVYVDASATLPNGHSVTAGAETFQAYWNSSALLESTHSLQSNAIAKTPAVAAINSRAINSGYINGALDLYVSGSAAIANGHSLVADLTFGSDIYVFAAAEMSHGHTLSGDLSYYYGVYVYGDSVMSHGHTVVADLTYFQDFFVGAEATLPHGHSLTADAITVWLASAEIGHGHSLSSDLTLGFDTYVYATATLSVAHSLDGDLRIYDPVDGSATVTQYHALNGSLNLVPHVDISATIGHDHSLQWDDSSAVYGSSLLASSHQLGARALGGVADLDNDPLWFSAEPLLDIEPRARSGRVTQETSFTFSVEGFRYRVSGLNFCSLNGVELNSSCASFPEPDISFTFNQQWGLGESQWSLDQEWEYVFDKDQYEWSLDQKWELDTSDQTVQQAQLDIEYAFIGGQFALDLLGLVNTARQADNLTPVGLYRGPGEDIATTHSENMANTGVYAHEDGALPSGYQTITQRVSKVEEVPTGHGENIAATVTLNRHWYSAEQLFDLWWNSPPHKANILADWAESDTPKMMIGYSMLYGWDEYTDLWTTFYTQVFLGFGIPLGATLAQWQLGLTYQLDTVLITNLNVQYALDAYTRVRTQHEGEYALKVTAQCETPYGARVAAQNEAPIHFSVVAQHECGWTQAEPITVQFDTGYDMDQYTKVLQSIAMLWNSNISCQHVSEYALNISLKVQHEAGYEPSVTVVAQNETKYDIQTYERVRTSQTHYWAMYDTSVTVTNSFAILTLKR